MFEKYVMKITKYENENFSILPTEKIYRIQLEVNDLLVELEKDHEKWEKIKEEKKNAIIEIMEKIYEYPDYQLGVFKLLSQAGIISNEIIDVEKEIDTLAEKVEKVAEKINFAINKNLNTSIEKLSPNDIFNRSEEEMNSGLDPFVEVKRKKKKKNFFY